MYDNVSCKLGKPDVWILIGWWLFERMVAMIESLMLYIVQHRKSTYLVGCEVGVPVVWEEGVDEGVDDG